MKFIIIIAASESFDSSPIVMYRCKEHFNSGVQSAGDNLPSTSAGGTALAALKKEDSRALTAHC